MNCEALSLTKRKGNDMEIAGNYANVNTNTNMSNNRKNNFEILSMLLLVLFFLVGILLYWLCFCCGIGNFASVLILDGMFFVLVSVFIGVRALPTTQNVKLKTNEHAIEIVIDQMRTSTNTSNMDHSDIDVDEGAISITEKNEVLLEIIVDINETEKFEKEQPETNQIDMNENSDDNKEHVLQQKQKVKLKNIGSSKTISYKNTNDRNTQMEKNETTTKFVQEKRDKQQKQERKKIKKKNESKDEKRQIIEIEMVSKTMRMSVNRDMNRYRIISYEFGTMKSIDGNIICKYFTLKEILRCRLINTYFNNLICDRFNDIIWYDICYSLKFIPMKITEKEKEKESERMKNATDVFWNTCNDNGVSIDSLIKILEKNCVFESKSKLNENTNEKNKFMAKLNDKCAHFFKRYETVKADSRKWKGCMFLKNINHRAPGDSKMDNNDYRENVLKLIKADKPEASPNKKCHILLKFIELIGNIISDINKYSVNLWSNERNFYTYYPKLKLLYNDLFDIFYYFGWYLGNEEKYSYNKNESCYFYETVLTWITVRFLDKLPVTPQFIGDFGDRDVRIVFAKFWQNKRTHLDWGNVSFIEFFLTFKTDIAMKYPFLKCVNCARKMQRPDDDYDGDEFVQLFAKQLPALFYDLICSSDNWFDYIGLWRINFILSMYFLSNDKHLGNRDHLVEVMLNFPMCDVRSLLHTVLKNYMYRGYDITFQRLQFAFLYDACAFGTYNSRTQEQQQANRMNTIDSMNRTLHFNPWRWISLYERTRLDEVEAVNVNMDDDMDILESGREKNHALFQVMLMDDEMTDDDITAHDENCRLEKMIVSSYFTDLDGDYCWKSCNYEHENVNDPKFRSEIKRIIDILHNDKEKKDNNDN